MICPSPSRSLTRKLPKNLPAGLVRARCDLAERVGVDEPALAPEPVDAALEAEPLRAEMALVDLAEVPGGLDREQRPVVVEAEHLAEVALEPEHAPDLGVVGLLRQFVDVLLRDV